MHYWPSQEIGNYWAGLFSRAAVAGTGAAGAVKRSAHGGYLVIFENQGFWDDLFSITHRPTGSPSSIDSFLPLSD